MVFLIKKFPIASLQGEGRICGGTPEMKAKKERKGKNNFIFKRSEEGNQIHLSFINL